MGKHIINTATLPPSIQEKYEIVGSIVGGPVIDLPNYRQYGVDFANLTEEMAENLVKRKWPYIKRREHPVPPPAPELPAEPSADPATEPSTDEKPTTEPKRNRGVRE